MNRINKLIGLTVYTEDSMREIGDIGDIALDSETKKIKACVMMTKSIIPIMKLIKFEDVLKMEKGALWIESEKKLLPYYELRYFPNSLLYRKDIVKKSVSDISRGIRGVVKDAGFDSETGLLTEFVVSNGMIEDVLHGRKRFKVTEKTCFSEKNIDLGKE